MIRGCSYIPEQTTTNLQEAEIFLNKAKQAKKSASCWRSVNSPIIPGDGGMWAWFLPRPKAQRAAKRECSSKEDCYPASSRHRHSKDLLGKG